VWKKAVVIYFKALPMFFRGDRKQIKRNESTVLCNAPRFPKEQRFFFWGGGAGGGGVPRL
jgi:hypothetical protein